MKAVAYGVHGGAAGGEGGVKELWKEEECFLAKHCSKGSCSKGQLSPLRVVVHHKSRISPLAGNAVYIDRVRQGLSWP